MDKNTRVYIAGCGGMLGDAVYNLFSSVADVKATDINLSESWLSYADVRDRKSIGNSIREFRPHLLINLAAVTDMEACETDSENAWLTNAVGAQGMAVVARELDIPYVYISTAGIFSGEKEYFDESDTPRPLSWYARTKYNGEVFVRDNLTRYFIVRAGWMMGGGPKKDKKFINKIYHQIVNGGTVLNAIGDKAGTVTYTADFAKGLLKIIESRRYGLYHQACRESCTRYELTVAFVRLLGLEHQILVNKVSSDYFKSEYFAYRPANENLVSIKLDAFGLSVMRDWKTCLAEYSQEFIKDIVVRGGHSVR